MPSTDEIYGGMFLKVTNFESLGYANRPLTITFVKKDEFKGKVKLTISFAETDRTLTLNKTQADAIASKHGKEYNLWGGKQITLSKDKTEFPRGSGTMVDTIKVTPV